MERYTFGDNFVNYTCYDNYDIIFYRSGDSKQTVSARPE